MGAQLRIVLRKASTHLSHTLLVVPSAALPVLSDSLGRGGPNGCRAC